MWGIFVNFSKNKELQIQALVEKLRSEKEKQKKRYQELESHLQRRMSDIDSFQETNKEKSILDENAILKKKFSDLADLLKQQEQLTISIWNKLNEN
ncbi:hypothetical protein M0811_04114 [Anaeramoeba ignava]|uniref:Uncharacterized protein n=1 Tax=Anaeramoeba ignava TaxID=1746090 RepID=A0A9Q0LW87_ANAIG|nr:hypothetical protein M0811_04114 [Anaeramoeba ignava]